MLECLAVEQFFKIRFAHAILLPNAYRCEHRTFDPASYGTRLEASFSADLQDRQESIAAFADQLLLKCG